MYDITALGITAICGIVAIECVALSNGIDGTMLSAALLAIGGVIGAVAKHLHTIKHNKLIPKVKK